MSGPRELNYTRRSDAVALHKTFVENVEARLSILKPEWTTPDGGARRHYALRYKWLSDKSGVPVRTVENLMTLSNQPTMVGAAKIAAALGVGLDTLLGQEDFGRAPSSDAKATLACIHIKKVSGMMVCAECLSKWQSYQQRLRALYETNRTQQRETWDAENATTRAAQLAAANLPKDTDER